jgi:hypothetical protein
LQERNKKSRWITESSTGPSKAPFHVQYCHRGVFKNFNWRMIMIACKYDYWRTKSSNWCSFIWRA